MSETLEIYRHSVAGFEIPLPPEWERTEEQEGCALVAVEPPREEPHLRASVVVTIEAPGEERPFEEWTDGALTAVRESLNRLRVIDDELVEIGGRPARRLLSHYVHRKFGGVCLEQWLLAERGLGYTISCSSAALEYDDLRDLMSSIAEGLAFT
jgi:hypothetical protein